MEKKIISSTIRLSDEEYAILDDICKKEGISTRNAGIKFLITTYPELSKRYNAELNAHNKAKSDYAELKAQVKDFFSAEEKLKKTISK